MNEAQKYISNIKQKMLVHQHKTMAHPLTFIFSAHFRPTTYEHVAICVHVVHSVTLLTLLTLLTG